MYDAIVVGAGPAGAYFAYLCAKSDLKVLLLEKELLPRRKCCAGGVLERALNQLDFSIPSEIVEREIFGATLSIGEHTNELRFNERASITVRRERFDRFLVRKAEDAGASLMQGVKASAVSEKEGSVEIRTADGAFEGRCAILANGANSKLAEDLMGHLRQHRFAVGMAFNCSLDSQPRDLFELYFHQGRGSFGAFSPPVYSNGWLFPCHFGANIGVDGLGVDKQTMLGVISRIETSCIERYGPMEWKEAIAGHPLPLSARRRLHTQRCMSIGDAGGLTNPITGEGMTYAFTSARMAARSAISLINEKDATATRRYENECRNTIVRDIDAARLTQRVIRSILGTINPEKFFDALCESDELKGACQGIIQGSSDWRRLLRSALPLVPSLYLRSIGD